MGCAVALAMLDIIEREQFVEQARTKGQRLLVKLKDALADHPHVGGTCARACPVETHCVKVSACEITEMTGR